MEWLGTQRYQASPAKSRGAAEEPATISIVALLALCHPWQLSGTVPPLVLSMAVIMPPSNPLALAREPAIVNMPNAAWLLVMLHAPARPSSGVGPGVAATTLGTRAACGERQGGDEQGCTGSHLNLLPVEASKTSVAGAGACGSRTRRRRRRRTSG